jgi:hypothetical protein
MEIMQQTPARADAKRRIRRVIKSQGLSAYFRMHIAAMHGDRVRPYVLASTVKGHMWTRTHHIGSFDEVAQMSDTALIQLIQKKFDMHSM